MVIINENDNQINNNKNYIYIQKKTLDQNKMLIYIILHYIII